LSGQLHCMVAYSWGKHLPTPIEQETRWVAEQFRTLWKRVPSVV